MRHFKWIEWNLGKVSAHGLSSDDVEAAFNRIHSLQARNDGSILMYAETPSGRAIWVIWRYDRDSDHVPNVFDELDDPAIFVITAY